MKVAAANPSRKLIAGTLAALALSAISLMPATAETSVNYNYGSSWGETGFFDPVEGAARRATLEAVVDYILSQIANAQEGRTLNLHIYPTSNPEVNAEALVNFSGPAGTYVNSSIYLNLVEGVSPISGSDLSLFVNFGNPNTDYYVGSGVPAPTQTDLFTLLLHEMTHGLGFSAKMSSSGSSTLGGNRYPVYSSHFVRGDGTPLLVLVDGVPTFSGTADALTSMDVYFAGPKAVAANGGNPVQLFAPANFKSGASLHHISNSSSNLLYAGESKHVMRPALGNGIHQREWTTIERAMLEDIGWELIGPGSVFTDWIAGYPGVGGLTGLADDPDGDGIGNGLENYFGTDPGAFSSGVVVTGRSGNTLIFTHPLGGSPATDISAAYRWSKDLAAFHADGATVDGTTVTFTRGAPVGGMVEVTATISGTPLNRLFVVVEATQN